MSYYMLCDKAKKENVKEARLGRTQGVGKFIKEYAGVMAAVFFGIITSVFFGHIKQGYFLDELFSYGLSNSTRGGYVQDYFPEGDIRGNIITPELIEDYLTVQPAERFSYVSVYRNQIKDCHSPFYYMLLHTVCSFFPDRISKWFGLGLNIALMALVTVMVYIISLELYQSTKVATSVSFLYALSQLAISLTMLIRMYALQTLLIMVLAKLVLDIYNEKNSKRTYVLYLFTVLLGALSQYQFLFFAFYVTLFLVIVSAKRKRIKTVMAVAGSSLGGVALFFCVWPYVITQTMGQGSVSASGSLAHVLDIGQYGLIITFVMATIELILPTVAVAGVSMVLYIIIKYSKKAKNESVPAVDVSGAGLLFVAGVLYFITVCIISPVPEIRYTWGAISLIMVLTGVPLKYLDSCTKIKKMHLVTFYAFIVLGSLFWLTRCEPFYLYKDENELNEMYSQFSGAPCIYFTNNDKDAITADLIQLSLFKDVYVTDRVDWDLLGSYIDSHGNGQDAVVVYIDTDEEWSAGFDAGEYLGEFYVQCDGKYTDCYYLGRKNMSETYIMTR